MPLECIEQKAMPKIFFVGDFSKHYSSEVYIAYGLEQCGAEVYRFQENSPVLLNDLVDLVVDWKPDFVLCSKNRLWSNGMVFINRMKQRGIKTVSWLFDLYVNLPNEMGATRTTKDSPFFCDYVFMSDGGDHKEFEKINKITLRQGIHEPEAEVGNPLEKKFDVVFIGSNTYLQRQKMISKLREWYGDKFCHIGIGGNAPEVRGLDLNNVLVSTKIVVGDSVPSDNYWSNRIYEILGRGGFLLHPKVNGLEKEFEYYKHFVPFEHGNLQQLKEIIDYYLTHDKERWKIQLDGHKFCKENYTYTLRCKTLLQTVIGRNELENTKTV